MSQPLGWGDSAALQNGGQSGAGQFMPHANGAARPAATGEPAAQPGAVSQHRRLGPEEIMKIAKTLEAMKASGYDTSDARYLTLLQILKKHTQQGELANTPTPVSSSQANGPAASGHAYSQHSAAPSENGGQNPSANANGHQSRPFTQEQLIQLRAQILAYKYLSRNIPLPPNILQGIRGAQAQRVGVPQQVPRGNERLARMTPQNNPMTGAPQASPYGNSSYGAPKDAAQRARARRSPPSIGSPQFSQISQPEIVYTQQPKLPPKWLALEREKRIVARVQRRLDELQGLPIDIPPELQLKAKIEFKELQLLPLQKKLRQKIAQEIRQETTLQVAEDQSAYRRQSRKHLKQIATTSTEKQKEREEAKKKKRQAEFAAAVVSHVKTFRDFHGALSSRWKKINRGIANAYANRLKRKQAREEREERERLALLKENDEEGYLRLLERTKNKRLGELLEQTNEYLKSIGALVARHQEEEEEEEKRWRQEAEQKEKEDKGKEKEGDSEQAKSEEDGDGTGVSKGKKVETYYTMAHSVEEEITKQPELLSGGSLKHYQMIGLQWLVSLYNNKLNGVLADEMGLGKTIQTIALVCYLMESKGNNGPYLVVVPLSTLANWDLEFEKWAPAIIRVVYKGNPPRRKFLYNNQIQHGKFNVVLTTYEYVIKDKAWLSKIRWNYIIIDEGHRMKNHSCKLVSIFGRHYKSRHRLLLTGTPLQNSLPELWSLLNFLLPTIFNSVDNFEEWFNAPFAATGEKVEMTEEEKWIIINRLHKVLRPFLLRRLKKNVEDQLPDKVEKVLKCGFSAWQHRMYEQMRERGVIRVEASKDGKQSVKGLMNTLMQLRKICNHPYLFNEKGDWPTDWNIVRSAGKFDLLDHILPKLQRTGHKVLIFSQMTQLITILEDYFRLKGFLYLRLDGSTKSDDRAELLRSFNAPDSPYFIFVLSTRAGGLGLNLQSADTVILFDSDWNPHIDLQAQDRAHRIGQTREVRVFRLITVNSIEENILARASFKMGLDAKIIEAGMFNKKSNAQQRKNMLEDLLRRDQEKKDIGDDLPSDAEINQMLARGEQEFELFQQMDTEREQHLLQEWKKLGKRGPPQRLMQDDELPEWMVAAEQIEDEATSYGRGMRERKEVFYDDDLTENQWAKILEEGGDEEDITNFREANKRRRSRRAARASGLEIDDNEEADEVDEAPKRKRRRRELDLLTDDPEHSEGKDEDGDVEGEKEGEGDIDGLRRTKRKTRTREREKGEHETGGEKESEKVKQPRKRARNKQEVSPEQLEFNSKCMEIWNIIRQAKDEDAQRIRSEIFLVKPSRRVYPDYYEVIASPIDLTMIKKSIESSKYPTKEAFMNDFLLLFKNAQEYNTAESQVFADAVFLQNVFMSELAQRFGAAESVAASQS